MWRWLVLAVAFGMEVTVVVNSKNGNLRRVVRSVELYVSYGVTSVIVCWHPTIDGEAAPMPLDLEALKTNATEIVWVPLTSTDQSVHARWTKTMPYITTEYLLAVDDDVIVFKPAVECLLLARSMQSETLMAGPFVRNVAKSSMTYLQNDDVLKSGDQGAPPEYAILLPRILLVKTAVVASYRKSGKDLLRYTQLHDPLKNSDDIFLSFLARDSKLRVLPPPSSIFDYDRECRTVNNTETFWKTSILRLIATHPHNFGNVIHASNTTTCDLINSTLVVPRSLRPYETRPRFNDMFTPSLRDLFCGDRRPPVTTTSTNRTTSLKKKRKNQRHRRRRMFYYETS